MQFVEPKILSSRDSFKWWFLRARKERPHLKMTEAYRFRLKNMPANKTAEIISKNIEELNYLRKKVLELDVEIIELEKSDLHKWYFTETTHKISALKKKVYYTEDRIKKLEKADPKGIKVLMNYNTYMKVIDKYSEKAVQALVDGETVRLHSNLGYLYILKQEKENFFSSVNIDWPSSQKLKAEIIAKGEQIKDKEHPKGKNWFQYYEDKDYLRIAWYKRRTCTVPNNSVYTFYPSHSDKGVVRTLVHANKADAYLKEKYVDLTRKKKS